MTSPGPLASQYMFPEPQPPNPGTSPHLHSSPATGDVDSSFLSPLRPLPAGFSIHKTRWWLSVMANPVTWADSLGGGHLPV